MTQSIPSGNPGESGPRDSSADDESLETLLAGRPKPIGEQNDGHSLTSGYGFPNISLFQFFLQGNI